MLDYLRAALQAEFRRIAVDMVLLAPVLAEDGGGGYEVSASIEHACKGWPGKFSGNTTQSADRDLLRRSITILADTLNVVPDDTCSVRIGGQEFRVLSAAQDQLGAAWIIEVQP